MKVFVGIFHKEVELTEKDVVFVLLYAEVRKSFYEKYPKDFQGILEDAMFYLFTTSIETDMDYEEIQDYHFEEHKDIVKNLCF